MTIEKDNKSRPGDNAASPEGGPLQEDVTATEFLNAESPVGNVSPSEAPVTANATEIIVEPRENTVDGATTGSEPVDSGGHTVRHTFAHYVMLFSLLLLALAVLAIFLKPFLDTTSAADPATHPPATNPLITTEPYEPLSAELQTALADALSARNYHSAYRIVQRPDIADAYQQDMQAVGEMQHLLRQGQAHVYVRELAQLQFRTEEFSAQLPHLREQAPSAQEIDYFVALDALWARGELIAALNEARAVASSGLMQKQQGEGDGGQKGENHALSAAGKRTIARQLRHYQTTVQAYDTLLASPAVAAAAELGLTLDPQRDEFFLTQMRADFTALDTALEQQARANVDYARQQLRDYDKKWRALKSHRSHKSREETQNTMNTQELSPRQLAGNALLVDIYAHVASAHRHGLLDDPELLRRLNRELVALYFNNGKAANEEVSATLDKGLQQLWLRRVVAQ